MKKSPGIRVIVGGPPNSGKSTLSESLAMALRSYGIDAYAQDLDLASETLPYIRGEKAWELRSKEKKPWTMELAEEAAKLFVDASQKYKVVIGDAPGKITPESRRIIQEATCGIVLCREDCIREMESWKRCFESLGVPTIVMAVSKMTGSGNVSLNEIINATIVGLDRKPKVDETIESLTWHIKERLNL